MKVITMVGLSLLSSLVAEEVPVWFGTGADGIYAATLDDESGVLTAARRVVEAESPGFLALRPGGKVLYAVTRDPEGGKVQAYQITENDGLKLLSAEASGGKGPCHVDVSPDGKVLLVANYGGGSVSSYAVAKEGGFAKASSVHQHVGSSVHPKRQKGPHAHGFFANAAGTLGYVPDLGIDQVVIYSLEKETGVVAKAGKCKMPPGMGPRHLKFGKDGKQIYVLGELNRTVWVGNLDEEGMPTEAQVIEVLPEGRDGSGMSCSEIRVHPNGRFVYTALRDLQEGGEGALTVFKVGAGGKLERIQVVSSECRIPRNFALDPSGKWLLVAGQKASEVPIFQVREDGTLAFTERKIAVPTAMCVVFGR